MKRQLHESKEKSGSKFIITTMIITGLNIVLLIYMPKHFVSLFSVNTYEN